MKTPFTVTSCWVSLNFGNFLKLACKTKFSFYQQFFARATISQLFGIKAFLFTFQTTNSGLADYLQSSHYFFKHLSTENMKKRFYSLTIFSSTWEFSVIWQQKLNFRFCASNFYLTGFLQILSVSQKWFLQKILYRKHLLDNYFQ